MHCWESLGTKLPQETCEPELLSNYVQGKQFRDWHITEYRRGIKEGLFKPWEFIGEGDITKENYKKILL